MKLFSVPADFRTSTIDQFADLNARRQDAAIAETYGSVTYGGFAGSGRRPSILPDAGLTRLEEYVRYAASKGIDFNYTLNASCVGNSELTRRGLRRAEAFLSRLWSMGIRHLTVSTPTLMSLIADMEYPFSVKASTICQINSRHKAEHYRDLGLDRLVIDEDITRDFRRIRQICEVFGDGVEMIINSLCIKDCPHKMFHYNHESHFSYAQDIKKCYSYYCQARAVVDPIGIMQLNWVRPEDLALYESAGIRRYKLQGRQLAVEGDMLRATEAYMDGTYNGNLFDLLWLFYPETLLEFPYYPYIDNEALEGFLRPFFDDPEHCTGDCDACGHCAFYAAASMDTAANRELLPAAREQLEKREDPIAVYRREHAAEEQRLSARVARRSYSMAKSARRRVLRLPE